MRIFSLILAVYAIAVIASFWTDLAWPLSLLGQFQAQLALSGAILTASFCYFRRFSLAFVALVFGCVSIWQMDLLNGERFAAPSALEGMPLSVAAANLFGSAHALDQLVDAHNERAFDLIVLTERPIQTDQALLSRFSDMNHIAGTPGQASQRRFRAVILSREEPRRVEVTAVDQNPFAITEADYCFQGARACLTVFAVHPPPPILKDFSTLQQTTLQALAKRISAAEGAVLVTGDFNAVSWSPEMMALQERSDIRKVACGARWSPTWLTPIPGLGLELDHVFIKGDIGATGCALGPFVWSDHWPVFAELFLKPSAKHP